MKIRINKFLPIRRPGTGLILLVNQKDHPRIIDACRGDILQVDNKDYQILSIEMHQTLTHPPITGDNYGFIVRRMR